MEWNEALKKYGFTALVAMILAGTIILDTIEEMYKCSSTGDEFMAIGLSDTSKTAVNQYGIKKVCRNGVWEKQAGPDAPKEEIAIDSVKVKANNKEWICEIDNGEINSYTRCHSGSYEGYLGEFI